MKKEFEHKPKNSPPHKGEDSSASAEVMGSNEDHLPAQFLNECAPVTLGLA